jgi:hypothetical protein
MNNYFEVTVKYEKTAEDGRIIKVSEKYLVDALSFTEAEARITKEMEPFISGEYQVKDMKRYRVDEMFWEQKGDKWFRAKVNHIVLDEEKGAEKKIAAFMLTQANDIKEAREGIVNGMKGSMADYEIVSITETKIIEVFKY